LKAWTVSSIEHPPHESLIHFNTHTQEVAMEGTAEKAPKNKKTVWVAGGLIVALVLIVYFSFFYPPVANDEGQGSIGAAKKYRSEQITDKDVQFAKVEKADEATIKEMESAAQNLGKVAEQMGRNTVASKFAGYAANAAGALDRAAKLAREGIVAKEWAIDAAKAGTECYAALSSLLEAKGVSEAKFAALKPIAAKAELAAMVASIGAAAQSSLEMKQLDAKSAGELSSAPSVFFEAMARGTALDEKAGANLLAATAPLEKALAEAKAGKLDQQAVAGLEAKFISSMKENLPAAAGIFEAKALEMKALESKAAEVKSSVDAKAKE
jgi:hypothetical protein